MTTTHTDRSGHDSDDHPNGGVADGAIADDDNLRVPHETDEAQPSGSGVNGALDRARQLWSTAELIEDLLAQRQELATSTISGPLGAEIARRIEIEMGSAASVAEALRAEALWWADEWYRVRKGQGVEHRSIPRPPMFPAPVGGAGS